MADMPDPETLLNREPTGMTVREMLLRIDARQDRYEQATEKRVRALEDEALTARVERKTIMAVFGGLRATVLMAAAVGPILAGIIAFMAKP